MGPGSPDVIYCYGCAAAEKAKGVSSGETVELKMLDGYYNFVNA